MDSTNNNSAYYCNFCDKSVNLGHKKKHLNTQSHKDLSYCIITRYHIKNPGFFEIEDLLQKCIDEFDKKFGL